MTLVAVNLVFEARLAANETSLCGALHVSEPRHICTAHGEPKIEVMCSRQISQ